jgi:hypothetical protein
MKSIFLSPPYPTVPGQPANICESATLSQFLLLPGEINRVPRLQTHAYGAGTPFFNAGSVHSDKRNATA